MTKRRIGAALMMIGCMALLMAGCAKKDPQTATLTLPSNPTTGYEWMVTQEPELFEISSQFAEDVTENEDEEEMALVGAGGTETFKLTPKAAGTATVEFTYERSFEDAEPESSLKYTIKVTKDMQLSVEAFAGDMPGDIAEMPELPQLVIE